MNKRVNITVVGKVQGVFFRATAKQTADNLGICGKVCNLKNGNVYIEAAGDASALEKFIEWCHQGPSGADVREVVTNEGDWQDFSGFEIIR